MSLDWQRAVCDFVAHLSQTSEVVGVDGQLVNGDVIGSLGRVRPPQDGIGSSVQDIFGIGASQIGGEGHVEGMVDLGVANLRRRDGRGALGSDFVVRMQALHRHAQVGPRGHAECGTHPL